MEGAFRVVLVLGHLVAGLTDRSQLLGGELQALVGQLDVLGEHLTGLGDGFVERRLGLGEHLLGFFLGDLRLLVLRGVGHGPSSMDAGAGWATPVELAPSLFPKEQPSPQARL
ncbi:hypothetical protein D3C86_1919750 [compost metagenome]